MLSFPSVYHEGRCYHRGRLEQQLETFKGRRISCKNPKMYIDENKYTIAVAKVFRHDVDVLWSDMVKAVIVEVNELSEMCYETSGSEVENSPRRSNSPSTNASCSLGKRAGDDTVSNCSPRSDYSDIDEMANHLKILKHNKMGIPTDQKMSIEEKEQTVFIINGVIRSNYYSWKSKRPLISKLEKMSPSLALHLFIE